MSKIIKVRVTKVYGHVTVYPVCETAKRLAALAGTKTLTYKAIMDIEALGYEMEVVPEPYKGSHAVSA